VLLFVKIEYASKIRVETQSVARCSRQTKNITNGEQFLSLDFDLSMNPSYFPVHEKSAIERVRFFTRSEAELIQNSSQIE